MAVNYFSLPSDRSIIEVPRFTAMDWLLPAKTRLFRSIPVFVMPRVRLIEGIQQPPFLIATFTAN